jgi:hypothetical protein
VNQGFFVFVRSVDSRWQKFGSTSRHDACGKSVVSTLAGPNELSRWRCGWRRVRRGQPIRISSPVFRGVGAKKGVQAFYVCDAEVVEMTRSSLSVVGPHLFDLLSSAATFYIFVGAYLIGAHLNNLSSSSARDLSGRLCPATGR